MYAEKERERVRQGGNKRKEDFLISLLTRVFSCGFRVRYITYLTAVYLIRYDITL